MTEILFLDTIRIFHLICLALGMGPALYFDLRTLLRIGAPFYPIDLIELHRIHKVVTAACLGLWLSGLTLIWWQTQFDLSHFSPKLWCKIGVVTTLTLNAIYLNQSVMPTLARHVGARLIDVPLRRLLTLTLCAGLSSACWILALVIGASRFFKTADWFVLLPSIGLAAVICIGAATLIMLAARGIIQRSNIDRGFIDEI